MEILEIIRLLRTWPPGDPVGLAGRIIEISARLEPDAPAIHALRAILEVRRMAPVGRSLIKAERVDQIVALISAELAALELLQPGRHYTCSDLRDSFCLR